MLEGTVLKSSPPRSVLAKSDDTESVAGVADLMRALQISRQSRSAGSSPSSVKRPALSLQSRCTSPITDAEENAERIFVAVAGYLDSRLHAAEIEKRAMSDRHRRA